VSPGRSPGRVNSHDFAVEVFTPASFR